MKNLKTYTMLLLIGMLLPSISFSQNLLDEFLLEVEKGDFNVFNFLEKFSHDRFANIRNEEEFLLATRKDRWVDDTWLYADSSEYSYNNQLNI